jgi:hypothetical protein
MIASICVFGPFFRFPPAGQRAAMVELTVQTAAQISERLQTLAGRLHEGNVTATRIANPD